MEFKLRASKAAALLANKKGTGLTDNMKRQIFDFETRVKSGKPLTEKQQKDYDDLCNRRDAPFELGDTIKSYIEAKWMEDNYGYSEPVIDIKMLKGELCEQDGLDLINSQLGYFCLKNQENFQDDFFTGTPDAVTPKIIFDVKCPWTFKTFKDEVSVSDYYVQGQVYLHLTGRKKFMLCFTLVDTPAELVLQETKHIWYKFNAPEESEAYNEIERQIEFNHYPSKWLPEENRIKTFEFDYDPSCIEELQRRMPVAREYYNSLTIEKIIHKNGSN